MVTLDTNIFIYLASGRLSDRILAGKELAYASVTRIESLGFPRITVQEAAILENILDAAYRIDLDPAIINQAVKLRQQRKMTLGDAIVAASALVHELVLWTANTEDFQDVPGLQLYNPLLKAAS